MFRRIVVTALLAGALAGLVAAGAQRVKLVPLIAVAETYEEAAAAHDVAAPAAEATATAPGHAGHEHGAAATAAAAWEPQPGFERTAYTILADVLTGIGFALLLTGAIALAGLLGHAVDVRRGFAWGAAGFVIFALAPALGLPPLPPGAEAAELTARQTWWIGTVLATAGGLGLIVFVRQAPARLAGIVLLIVPHVIGAPHPAVPAGNVPGDIVAQFVMASIATAALFWLVLGGATGWLYRRLE